MMRTSAASTKKLEKNKRRNSVLIVASHRGGKKDFIEIFLGFLVALGVLLIGHGEEYKSSGITYNDMIVDNTFVNISAVSFWSV